MTSRASHDDNVDGTKPTENELQRAAVRAARPIEKFRNRKADRADDRHPRKPVDAIDVDQNVVDQRDRQARQQPEQVAELQKKTSRKEFPDLRKIGLGPVTR